MNIIFICGSIQEGHDGVGDYTRRLGFELKKSGHNISIISLFEKTLNKCIQERQLMEENTIEVLKIPSKLSNNYRFTEVASWIVNKNPDWVSLQFVTFSFHPKGLPYGIIDHFYRLRNLSKWHIMFHEIWVGIEKTSTLKEILWGKFQQKIILKLIQILQPEAIHTHASVYKYQLEKHGVKTKILPLFSNIPLYDPLKITYSSKVNRINLVIFGSIHPGAPIQKFASELKKYIDTNKLLVSIEFVGRNGTEVELWKHFFHQYDFNYFEHGEKSPEEISKILLSCDYGISTTPFKLIEKSGVVAAMIDHGLMVICVAKNWEVKGFVPMKPMVGIVEYKPGFISNLFSMYKPRTFPNLLQSTTDKFIKELS